MDENLTKNLVKTRKILRDKFRSIKIGAESTETALEKTFLPITKPVKQLLSSTTTLKKEEIPIDELLTEKDFKPFKRKKKLTKYKKVLKHHTNTPIKKEPPYNADDDDDEAFLSTVEADDDDDEASKTLIENNDVKEITNINEEINLLDSKKELDLTYGLHTNSRGEWMFGNSELKFINNDKLKIGNKSWIITPGLFNLLFHKYPRGYDATEISIYKKILLETNAYRKGFSAEGAIMGTKATKYVNIIKGLITPKTGSGLMQVNLRPSNYIYWDEPNELVNRLRLLVSSQSAGNNSHNNEIVSIIEELREANIIA